jgi:hypothetical protein
MAKEQYTDSENDLKANVCEGTGRDCRYVEIWLILCDKYYTLANP